MEILAYTFSSLSSHSTESSRSTETETPATNEKYPKHHAQRPHTNGQLSGHPSTATSHNSPKDCVDHLGESIMATAWSFVM